MLGNCFTQARSIDAEDNIYLISFAGKYKNACLNVPKKAKCEIGQRKRIRSFFFPTSRLPSFCILGIMSSFFFLEKMRNASTIFPSSSFIVSTHAVRWMLIFHTYSMMSSSTVFMYTSYTIYLKQHTSSAWFWYNLLKIIDFWISKYFLFDERRGFYLLSLINKQYVFQTFPVPIFRCFLNHYKYLRAQTF